MPEQNLPLTAQTDQLIDDCLAFIAASPTAFQAADLICNRLTASGFRPYRPGEPLKAGDRRLVLSGETACFAFSIGHKPLQAGFRLLATHLDSPALQLKPKAQDLQNGTVRLNTAPYGSPVFASWLDRPLSLAGRLVLQGDHPLHPVSRLLDIQDPFLVIPGLAIHLDPTVNDNMRIDPQQVLLPVLSLAGPGQDPGGFDLNQLLASRLGVEVGQLLAADLFLYDPAPGVRLGLEADLIHTPRLDNLGLAHAALVALERTLPLEGVNLVAFFDHEEVGSRSPAGASSPALRSLMQQLMVSLGASRGDLDACLEQSFLISADQAHALHPAHADRSDPTNRPLINQGPVIKHAANRAYTTDASSSAVFQMLCRRAGVPCQTYANRSTIRGGSTLGPLLIEHLPVRSVDVGNPIWSMHAIRETGGVTDQVAITRVFETFFSLA